MALGWTTCRCVGCRLGNRRFGPNHCSKSKGAAFDRRTLFEFERKSHRMLSQGARGWHWSGPPAAAVPGWQLAFVLYRSYRVRGAPPGSSPSPLQQPYSQPAPLSYMFVKRVRLCQGGDLPLSCTVLFHGHGAPPGSLRSSLPQPV